MNNFYNFPAWRQIALVFLALVLFAFFILVIIGAAAIIMTLIKEARENHRKEQAEYDKWLEECETIDFTETEKHFDERA
jgi:uncharacterized membrane-anchored protein YhcB (DUF1043 family)